MKKSLIFLAIMCWLFLIPANAQVGKFLKNVKSSVKQELLGTPDNKNNKPEPPCACDPTELILELGKYQVDYSELNISMLDDGSILVKDIQSNNYYISKGGVSEGPYKERDPKIAQFSVYEKSDNEVDEKDIPLRYKSYISKSGEKSFWHICIILQKRML